MRKKLLSLLLTVALVLSLMVVPVGAESDTTDETTEETATFVGGDGTEENPYQVATAEQLDAVRNDLSAYYIQTADIDMSGIAWVSIGNYDTPFTGTYDGDNYKISNLAIDSVIAYSVSSSTCLCGLFGYIQRGTLQNIVLESSSIYIDVTSDNTTYKIGSIVGYNSGGTIEGCSVSGSIQVYDALGVAYSINIGGIVGQMVTNGNATPKCTNYINYASIACDVP